MFREILIIFVGVILMAIVIWFMSSYGLIS